MGLVACGLGCWQEGARTAGHPNFSISTVPSYGGAGALDILLDEAEPPASLKEILAADRMGLASSKPQDCLVGRGVEPAMKLHKTHGISTGHFFKGTTDPSMDK